MRKQEKYSRDEQKRASVHQTKNDGTHSSHVSMQLKGKGFMNDIYCQKICHEGLSLERIIYHWKRGSIVKFFTGFRNDKKPDISFRRVSFDNH